MIKNKITIAVIAVFLCNIFYSDAKVVNAAINKPPSIHFFGANPSSFVSGQTTTLSWSVSAANSIAIDQGVGVVTNLNNIIVAPSATITYKLTARNSFGTRTANVTVTVTAPLDQTPPAISGIQPSNISQSGATISWTTNEPGDSQVEYGTTISYGQVTPQDAALKTAHSVGLSGLLAGTLYHFRVKSKDAAGNMAVSGDQTFTTTVTIPVVANLSPNGQNLPSSSTSVNLTWPAVPAASAYKVFAYDRTAPEEVHCAGGSYYFCSDTTFTSAAMQVTSGHVYQWWVKAYNSQGAMISEKEALFAVSTPPNTLTVRVSKSYVQPGEHYYLYAIQHPTPNTITDYSGPLEVLANVCQPNNPSSCSTPTVFAWLPAVNGVARADLPVNMAAGIYKARFRPSGSTIPWSNEIAVHVGTTAGLIDMTKFWTLPTNTVGYFSGINTSYNEPFNSGIWYAPMIECPGLEPGALTMHFTKEKPEAYWSPKIPELSFGDGTATLKWYLSSWQKKAGWHDDYLTAFGHSAFQYDPGNLLPSGNFETMLSSIKYGSLNPELPAYILAPRYVGMGYGIQNNRQLYAVAAGDVPMCALDPNLYPGSATNWYVYIDKTVLHTAGYEGPVMRIRFHEGSFDGTSFGGGMIREDWYFAENIGLVRIEQKFFSATTSPSSLNPVRPCGSDPDCTQNEYMVNPQDAMNFTGNSAMPRSDNQVAYNGNHQMISMSGGWVNYPLGGAHDNDEICTATSGASATMSFPASENVTRFKLYAAKAFNRAKMEVYIDGVSKGLFDAYDPGVQICKMIFDSGQLTPGAHEIKIVNRSTDPNKPYIGIDKIVVSKQE